ncbi:MAG: hypothetical protein KME32_15190 [Mojavia pulchra JT2-VF2]|uniref:Proteinase inhibitor I42 chagasin domain-containing protein n=1 Tax=Mojavia pulchra JT2-VF2 TaxID=287848 RepID=A0A951PXV2_9NOST|nr:hypothetical protein [Mojavia pulchra JT2-VF2]
MRICAATVVLTSSWLVLGIIAAEPINATPLAANAGASSQSVKTQPIIVEQAEFGVVRVDPQAKVTLIPTLRVPLQEGSKYGWQIQLKNYQGKVTWREILRLPKRPETWGVDSGENLSISPNGMEAVTKRTQSIADGVIQNFWTITPGDPPGKHKIEVYIDERLIRSFEFEIIPLAKQKTEGRI